MSSKYVCQIDAFEIELETISDTFDKSLAVYEFPFQDGGAIQNMGMKARYTRFRCHFMEERYEQHFEFLAYAQENRVVQLVHPHMGVLRGQIQSATPSYDDTISHAAIDIVFIEDKLSDVDIAQEQRVRPQLEEKYAALLAAQQAEFAEDLREVAGSGTPGILSKVIDSSKSMVSQIGNVSSAARNFVAKIDADIATMEATLNSVSNPANSVISTVELATNMPGRVVGAIAHTVERYAESLASVVNSPRAFASSLVSGITELQNSAQTLAKHICIGGAGLASVRMAYLYDEDESARSTLKASEQTRSFSVEGRLLRRSVPTPVFSVNDLEGSLAVTREYLQDAINFIVPRTGSAVTVNGTPDAAMTLRAMARDLLSFVSDVKLEREKIYPITVKSRTPLHVICMQLGLPYQYAERILGINPQIENPNYVEGTINVYSR